MRVLLRRENLSWTSPGNLTEGLDLEGQPQHLAGAWRVAERTRQAIPSAAASIPRPFGMGLTYPGATLAAKAGHAPTLQSKPIAWLQIAAGINPPAPFQRRTGKFLARTEPKRQKEGAAAGLLLTRS